MRLLEGVNVLVVDDDPDTRDMLAMMLEMYGASVETAATARDGVRLVEGRQLGIILCDITLPDADGYEFLARVRTIANGARVPAIALTGRGLDDDRARALAAGYSLHLTKPVAPDELIARIGEIANRSAG